MDVNGVEKSNRLSTLDEDEKKFVPIGNSSNSSHDPTISRTNDDISHSHSTPRTTLSSMELTNSWSPTGIWWRDLLYFVGPGWFVSIGYVDPGNYQADIQAGYLSRYSLLCIIWWTSILSIYVQILCVRLSHYGGVTLAESQAQHTSSNAMRIMNWLIAEFSTMVTDLPEVIGIGIACNIFFSWPYWIGVVLSLGTTMVFLATLDYNQRYLEGIIAIFLGIMTVALFIEMTFVGIDTKEMVEGWAFGIKDLTSDDFFSITGVVGSVVMPHNTYLHTGACQSRMVSREHVEKAVFYSSIEPILPVLVSFFINLAVVSISAERVYGVNRENDDDASMITNDVGLTDFCNYFESLVGGCILWGIALLAAGQSSAITTTYAGQYVMDGFLNIQLPIRMRAIITRLVAIAPCVIVSIAFPDSLNQMVNVVNAMLAFLLPFAFTPLVKYNCDETIMGPHASKGIEKVLLYSFAFIVWLVNACGLSLKGGGFFGDARHSEEGQSMILLFIEIILQTFYCWWNLNCITAKITNHEALSQANDVTSEFRISTPGEDIVDETLMT